MTPPPLDTPANRITRVEEQILAMRQDIERAAKELQALRDEQRVQIEALRTEQREHAETIAKASGGIKVLLMLSAIGGALTLFKGFFMTLFSAGGR